MLIGGREARDIGAGLCITTIKPSPVFKIYRETKSRQHREIGKLVRGDDGEYRFFPSSVVIGLSGRELVYIQSVIDELCEGVGHD